MAERRDEANDGPKPRQLAGSMLDVGPYPISFRRRMLGEKIPIAKVDRRKPTQMR